MSRGVLYLGGSRYRVLWHCPLVGDPPPHDNRAPYPHDWWDYDGKVISGNEPVENWYRQERP